MPFRLWHILCTFVGPVPLTGPMVGMFLLGTSGVEWVWFVALVLFGVLAWTGAVMGVLLAIGRLRMLCPFCGASGPAGGNKRDGMWMTCPQCGYIHTAGPAGWRIVCEPSPPE